MTVHNDLVQSCVGGVLLAARLQSDPRYTSSLILVWEQAFRVGPQYPSARHVFHPMVVLFHAMNLLIFSDSSDHYGLKSVGGSEGIALRIVG